MLPAVIFVSRQHQVPGVVILLVLVTVVNNLVTAQRASQLLSHDHAVL